MDPSVDGLTRGRRLPRPGDYCIHASLWFVLNGKASLCEVTPIKFVVSGLPPEVNLTGVSGKLLCLSSCICSRRLDMKFERRSYLDGNRDAPWKSTIPFTCVASTQSMAAFIQVCCYRVHFCPLYF